MVVQYLPLPAVPGHVDGAGASTDEDLRANHSTASTATRTRVSAKWTDLSDEPVI